MIGGEENSYVRPVTLVVGLLVGLIGMTIIGPPIGWGAAMLNNAGSLGNAAVPIMLLLPMLSVVAIMWGMFRASLGESDAEDTSTHGVITRVVVLSIAAFMIGVYVVQLILVEQMFDKSICIANAAAAVEADIICKSNSIASGMSFTNYSGSAVTADQVILGKFTSVGPFLPLVPLAYAVAMLNFAVPQLGRGVLGSRLGSGARTAFLMPGGRFSGGRSPRRAGGTRRRARTMAV